jgi:putrescine transport system substrate-binding protein
MKLRPYVRKFQSQPVTDLVNGNLCLSLGYSGDMTQAQRTADSAGKSTASSTASARRHHGVDGHHGDSGRCQHPEYAYVSSTS